MKIPGYDQHKASNFDQAEKEYRSHIKEHPDDPDALHLLGLLLHQTGRSEAAIPLLKQAIELKPQSSQSIPLIAMALSVSDQDEEGLEYCKAGLTKDPDNANIVNAAGRIHQKLGDYKHAAHLFQRAAQIRPDFTDARHNLGLALLNMGQYETAAEQLEAAANMTPRNPYIHHDLALALSRLGDFEYARECLRTSLTLKTDNLEAKLSLARLNLQLCDWSTWQSDKEELSRELGGHVARQGKPMLSPSLLNYMDVSPALHNSVAGYYADQVSRSAENVQIERTRDRVENSNIRIGYVSPDFSSRAIGSLIYQMFRLHDRDKFDVYCYSQRNFDDDFRTEVKHGADFFRDVSGQSYIQTARQIAEDEIDILVNLSGYSKNTKPSIFALRPAPIQVSYLGYPNTMAAEFIDYIVADEKVLPREDERRFRESVIRLPGSFIVTSDIPTPSRTPNRDELGLPDDKFVFANFNEPIKYEPESFKAWMWILNQVPDSVLWLYSAGNATTEANIIRNAAALQIGAERLRFADTVGMRDYMARMRQADLILDTFIYNSGATAAAALMNGVPIVTIAGKTFASRLGASLNHAVGLNRLTCKNIEAYIQMCVYLGRNPDKL
ncbi:MAG: tetratricopeptide repeat protein, partial [Pseudomonadota bacterium]